MGSPMAPVVTSWRNSTSTSAPQAMAMVGNLVPNSSAI